MYCSLNKSNILAYSLWWAPLSWVIEGGITMQDRRTLQCRTRWTILHLSRCAGYPSMQCGMTFWAWIHVNSLWIHWEEISLVPVVRREPLESYAKHLALVYPWHQGFPEDASCRWLSEYRLFVLAWAHTCFLATVPAGWLRVLLRIHLWSGHLCLLSYCLGWRICGAMSLPIDQVRSWPFWTGLELCAPWWSTVELQDTLWGSLISFTLLLALLVLAE